jgi:hypothetical protein
LSPNLFTPAKTDDRRLKMYIFGPHGTGKTVTSLNFPSCAVADLDGGTDWYAGSFTFDKLRTTDVDKVFEAVDNLIQDPGQYKTLVIDSFTKFWQLLQEKHLKRLRVRKGNPQYVFQPSDYKVIKADITSFINKLLALDMNIIATAQVKNIYSQDTGEFMKITGTEPDGPKDAPYMFDVVLELNYGPNETRIAKVLKDRTNTLPTTFEFTYGKLVEYFGVKDLERAPVALKATERLNKVSNRSNSVKYKGKTILTAGVTGTTLEQLAKATEKLNDTELRDKLNEDYSVQSLFDLREDEAQTLLKDLIITNTAVNV